jgi:hypothetical protein
VTILIARETDLDGGACARVVGDDPEVIHQLVQAKKRCLKIAGFGQMRRCDIGDDAFDGHVWPVEVSRCSAVFCRNGRANLRSGPRGFKFFNLPCALHLTRAEKTPLPECFPSDAEAAIVGAMPKEMSRNDRSSAFYHPQRAWHLRLWPQRGHGGDPAQV